MPEAAEVVATADKLVEMSLFDAAILAYDKAIALAPTAPQYYVKRSTAYQRSGNAEAAVKDAEQAVVLAQQRGKAELIASAQVRRGYHHEEKHCVDAKDLVECVEETAGSKDKSLDIWISKNTRELAKLSEEEKKSSIDVIPKTLHYSTDIETAEEKDVQKTEIVDLKETSTAAIDKPNPNPEPVTTPAVPPAPTRVRHEWYQTDTHVFVDIFFKNIPKDQCSVELEPQSLSVSFPLPNGSDFTFELDPLSHPIDPTTSTHEILSTKLSLKLTKSPRGTKWPALESQTQQPTPEATKIAYPTSSRTGAKNWDKLEKEAIKDAEEWEKPDGDAAANALFKDLFKNATPEVRRAMEKSYVESNGTALSTNWEDVSKGRVDTKPPDSMLAKKWGE